MSDDQTAIGSLRATKFRWHVDWKRQIKILRVAPSDSRGGARNFTDGGATLDARRNCYRQINTMDTCVYVCVLPNSIFSAWFPLKPTLNFQERIVTLIDKIYIDKVTFIKLVKNFIDIYQVL